MRSHRLGRRIAQLAALMLAFACSRDSSPTEALPRQPSLVNSTVTANVDSLTADGTSTATITVQLRDAKNDTLTRAGEAVAVSASGGTMSAVTDHGNGSYSATFTASTSSGQVAISATLNGNALANTCTILLVANAPLLSNSTFQVSDTLLYGDGKSSTFVHLYLYDKYLNPVFTAPGPVVFATTKGSISPITPPAPPPAFFAILTSTAGDATASVTVQVNGQPVPFTLSVRFATHQVWAKESGIACCQYAIVAGSVNGIIYATGGYTYDADGDPVLAANVDAYDPASNSWTARAAMPVARYGHGMAGLNGALYVVGGYTDSGTTSSVVKFDPVSNSWSTVAPMPTARGGLGVSVVGGILYAIGGYGASGELDVVEAYDPAADSWSTRASLPTARSGLAAAVVNGILYAVGGDAIPTSAVYAYDPGTNSWTSKAFMPTGGSGLSAGALGSKVYSVGAGGTLAFDLFDPATNSWSLQPSMPAPSAASAVVNGSLYSVGSDGSTLLMYVP